LSDRDELIEAVTRRVLVLLEAGGARGSTTDDPCADCRGGCAARCADKVRAVVAEGAGRVSYSGGAAEVPSDLAPFIDHTLLAPSATAADIDTLCEEARRHGFAAVCVNPVWVARAARHLRGAGVKVASVVGFPLGATPTENKVLEARRALRDGAREIDMVIDIGGLRGGEHQRVQRDIARVADACRESGAICKVILETGLLTDEEKVVASRLARAARAHFVKTSTGFGPGGATVYDVALMREAAGPALGVKASGGIRTAEDAQAMIAAGATRIGASAGVAIVGGAPAGEGGRPHGRY
jgi:deoxyribose-phosphate aldolase